MDNIETIKQSTNNNIGYLRFSQGGDKAITAYMNLSNEESINLAKYALETENERTQWAILKNLAVYHPNSLSGFLDKILHKEIEDVGIAFKNANNDVCEDVIKRIENASSEHMRIELLLILAWIGTKKAQEKLSEFVSAPITHSNSKLYAEYFTTHAGWEFDDSMNKRDLFLLDRFPANVKDVDKPKLTGESCPWCKRPLLFAYNIDEIESFLPAFKNEKRPFQVMTCSHCVHFSTLYSETSASGSCIWNTHNTRPDYMKSIDGVYGEYHEFTPQITIEKRKTNPFEYENWLPDPPDIKGSLGGFPGWVQSPEFPLCPACKKTMIYIAQYDISWVVYAFRCFECKINATSIQSD